MAESEHKNKRKAGLHKEISSIFEGVPIPGGGVAKHPSGASKPAHTGDASARPPASEQQISGTVKPELSVQPIRRVAAAKELRAGAAKKTHGKSHWYRTWKKVKNKLFPPKEGAGSSRQKVMLILVPVLIILLIYVLMPVFKRSKISEPDEGKLTSVAADYKGKIDWQIPEPYPAGLRDPMQSALMPVVKQGNGTVEIGRSVNLIVKGIVYSRDNPAAVVGDQIVHEGDIISGASIIRIHRDNVEFEMNDNKWAQKVQH